MGDVFPPGDPVSAFVVAFSAALNDLIFVTRLLIPEDDSPLLTDDQLTAGERAYLLRLSVSHLYEVIALVDNAAKYEDVTAFLASLRGQAVECLAKLQSYGAAEDESNASPLKRTVKFTRNKTLHYPTPGNDDLRKTLRDLGPYRGVLLVGEKMPSIRAQFADDVMVQFATKHAPTSAELAELLSELADVTTAAIHLGQYILDQHLGSQPENVRHYSADAEIPDTEVPELEPE